MSNTLTPNNDSLAKLPFPPLKFENTVYRIMKYSRSLSDSDDTLLRTSATREAERIGNFRDPNRIKRDRPSFFNRVLSEFAYAYATEGEPFRHCTCGKPSSVLHVLQRVDDPNVKVVVGTDCMKRMADCDFKIVDVALSVATLLVDKLFSAPGKALLAEALAKNYVDERTYKSLAQYKAFKDLKRADFRYEAEAMFMKVQLIAPFVRGSLVGKVEDYIAAAFGNILVAATASSHFLTSDEELRLDTEFWERYNRDDKYAEAYVDIARKQDEGALLTPKQKQMMEFFQRKREQIDRHSTKYLAFCGKFYHRKRTSVDDLRQFVRGQMTSALEEFGGTVREATVFESPYATVDECESDGEVVLYHLDESSIQSDGAVGSETNDTDTNKRRAEDPVEEDRRDTKLARHGEDVSQLENTEASQAEPDPDVDVDLSAFITME
jgi:hypothetical protein